MLMPRIQLAFIALLALTACNDSSFSGSSKKLPASTEAPVASPSVEPKPSDAAPTEATEEFPLSAAQGKVDMIWVIDNSGSMKEEAEQVRNNFTKFLASLQNRTDTQLALISQSSTGGPLGTSVTLSAADLAKGHKQISLEVGSTNALAIVSSALCPLEATDAALGESTDFGTTNAMKICNQTIAAGANDKRFFIEGPDEISSVRGQLSTFLRPDAKRVIVVVTDDQAAGVTNANFMSLIAPYVQNSPPVMFAFRGVRDKAACSISEKGVAYETLASTTGGQVFDICDSDWSPNFTKLSEQVTQIANTSFTLKQASVKKVISVTVDGVTLTPDQYTVTGNSVAIVRAALPVTATKVAIHYSF